MSEFGQTHPVSAEKDLVSVHGQQQLLSSPLQQEEKLDTLCVLGPLKAAFSLTVNASLETPAAP